MPSFRDIGGIIQDNQTLYDGSNDEGTTQKAGLPPCHTDPSCLNLLEPDRDVRGGNAVPTR